MGNINLRRLKGRPLAGISVGVAALSLAGVAATVVPAPSASAAATSKGALTAPPVPDVTWSSCSASQPGLAGFQCATVRVPLDYSRPGGRQISLGLVEHPATTSGKAAGTLFFNPGGPDLLGSQYLPALLGGFGSQVVSQFNIVSWDPRGAGGLSTPAVQCLGSAADEADLAAAGGSAPLTPAQQATWAGLAAKLNQHCAGQDDTLLAHVSTADSARDLDLMRQALGQPKLNYYGISYGTLLGDTYANMFPGRAGKLILDGNIDPQTWFARGSQLSSFLRIGSDQATAATLNSFLMLCGKATAQQCAFTAGTPAATRQKFTTLLDRAANSPLVTRAGQAPVTENDIIAQTDGGLQVVAGWTGLAATLQALWTASTAPAAGTAPAATPSAGAAQAATAPYANAAKLSVVCGENPNPATIGQSVKQADVSLTRAGAGAATWAWDAYCVSWPVKAASAYTGPWNNSTSPVLVVNNTGDPATSYQNAQLTAQLLPGGHLITVQGYGHTELGNPSTCAQDYIARYLLKGSLPKAGATCQQDTTPFP